MWLITWVKPRAQDLFQGSVLTLLGTIIALLLSWVGLSQHLGWGGGILLVVSLIAVLLGPEGSRAKTLLSVLPPFYAAGIWMVWHLYLGVFIFLIAFTMVRVIKTNNIPAHARLY